MASRTVNENLVRAIAVVINEAQHQLRALHAVAHQGPCGADDGPRGITDEHITLLTESVSARVHSMLDSCLEHLGETRSGHFADAVIIEARACGIDLPNPTATVA